MALYNPEIALPLSNKFDKPLGRPCSRSPDHCALKSSFPQKALGTWGGSQGRSASLTSFGRMTAFNICELEGWVHTVGEGALSQGLHLTQSIPKT